MALRSLGPLEGPLTQITYTGIEHFCLKGPFKDTHYILSKIYLDFLQFLVFSFLMFCNGCI